MSRIDCPHCNTVLIEQTVGPCFICGSINLLCDKYYRYRFLQRVLKRGCMIELTICHGCFLEEILVPDSGSGTHSPDFSAVLETLQQNKIADCLHLVEELSQYAERQDKVCPTCNRRLTLLRMVDKIKLDAEVNPAGSEPVMPDEPIGTKSHHEEQGLDNLYRDVIFEHYRRPQNRGVIEAAQIVTKGNNPVCGDRVTIYGTVENGVLTDVRFEGKACAICMASTSMMTQLCKGKPLAVAGEHCDHFKAMIRNEAPFEVPPEVPDLEALEGVRKFSARVKCATLGWTTLKNGIVEYQAGKGNSSIDDSCAT